MDIRMIFHHQHHAAIPIPFMFFFLPEWLFVNKCIANQSPPKHVMFVVTWHNLSEVDQRLPTMLSIRAALKPGALLCTYVDDIMLK